MALKEIELRNSTNTHQVDGRKDLLSQLLAAHEKQPEKFTAGDVFAVSHGAM